MEKRKSEKAKIIFDFDARKRSGALLSSRLVRTRSFSLFHFFAFSLFYFSAFSHFAAAQIPSPPTKPNRSGAPAEKSIAVDAKVNIKLCVASGDLKINGWARNEIRAFVAGNDSGALGFKVLQKGADGNAVWVAVAGAESQKNVEGCLAGDSIELDVPRGATVNVKSRESETGIDSVGRATVENVGGNIRLSNVARGVEATTYEGDITVEKSGGAMQLQTTTGSIVAFALAPAEIGDAFKAKTASGAIVLRGVEHRQIEVNSNSGAIRFTGEFLAGGQYAFSAFNGSINLQIPQNSSCKINASYGFGAFNSDFALANVVKSFAAQKAQNLSAQIGASAAAATVNVSTYSGTIQIKKQ